MKKHASMATANIIAALLFIGLAIYAFVTAGRFKQFQNVPVGPDVFPKIMAIGLAVCALALIAQSLFAKKANAAEAAPSLSLKRRGIQYMLLTALLVVLLIMLWESAGFLIMAPIMMFCVMWLSGMRTYKTMVIISVGLSLLIWLLFWQVLRIEIPLGPLAFIY